MAAEEGVVEEGAAEASVEEVVLGAVEAGLQEEAGVVVLEAVVGFRAKCLQALQQS